MRRLISILLLLWICSVARGANPAFTDFNTNQFLSSPTGPEPKISLIPGGTVTNYVIFNITNTVLVSSNGYFTNISTTNIIVQSISITTNNTFFTFTTNLISQYSIITNLTVNYFTVNSNANIVGYIRDFNGLGTNTTLSQPVLVAPVYIVSSNGLPIAFSFLDADNSTKLGGWDTNRGGFWGDGAGLTNLQGTITSPGSTFGFIVVTNGITNLMANLGSPSVAWFDANNMLTNIPAQGANDVYAGPPNGANLPPTFRGLVGKDLDTTDAARKDINNAFSVVQSFPAGLTSTGMTNSTMTTVGVVTNDTNGGMGTTTVLPTVDGAAITNLTYKYTTNANNTGVFAFGKSWTTNISGNITLGSFTVNDFAAYESMVIWVTNTGASVFTVTLPGGVNGAGDGHPPVYYSTNGAQQKLKILVEHNGSGDTNSAAQHYW